MPDTLSRRRVGADIRRMIGFLFACSYHGVVGVPGTALMGVAQCTGRIWHNGPHTYPKPFVAREPHDA